MVSLTAPVLRVLQEVPRSRDDPHMFLGQNGKDAPVERPLARIFHRQMAWDL